MIVPQLVIEIKQQKMKKYTKFILHPGGLKKSSLRLDLWRYTVYPQRFKYYYHGFFITANAPELPFLSLFMYLSSVSTKHYLRNGKCSRKSGVPYMSLVSPFSFRGSVFLKTVCKQAQGQLVLTWAPKSELSTVTRLLSGTFPTDQENGYICSMEIKFSYCLTPHLLQTIPSTSVYP